MTMSKQWVRIWKELTVASLEVIFRLMGARNRSEIVMACTVLQPQRTTEQ
jgi:uncharacterized lipoprotein NlpE involved in copper resistance